MLRFPRLTGTHSLRKYGRKIPQIANLCKHNLHIRIFCCTFVAGLTFQIVKNVILGSIARTRVPKYDYQGIQIIDLAEWLLGK